MGRAAIPPHVRALLFAGLVALSSSVKPSNPAKPVHSKPPPRPPPPPATSCDAKTTCNSHGYCDKNFECQCATGYVQPFCRKACISQMLGDFKYEACAEWCRAKQDNGNATNHCEPTSIRISTPFDDPLIPAASRRRRLLQVPIVHVLDPQRHRRVRDEARDQAGGEGAEESHQES